ncbi:hypothetical protein RFF05_09880 [Bengtsoniella intestinalis]|uniref:hypothetical protein n=1 Tax=Bengtsoniella intestinalis TaxID=3073143 RepID=UPI00391F94E5
MKTILNYKRWLLIGLCFAIVVGLIVVVSGALWSEDDAVHIDPDEIPSSTLVIGTHLIHLSALTDSIYEVAVASAENSGQSQVYYKSELADGTWFDITTASELADITTGGTPVTTDVIAALFFTHHTKDDGITYDLRTDTAVCIFDIPDPYDIETLDELLPLKMRYDTIYELESDSATGQAKIAEIEEILLFDVQDSYTDGIDAQIAALEVYCNVLREYDAPTQEIIEVQTVQAGLDAERRAYVFAILLEELATYMDTIYAVTDTYDDDGELIESESADTALQSAVSESYENVGESLINYESITLIEGSTVFSSYRYGQQMELVANAEATNHTGCDTNVANLIHLNNIESSQIVDATGESALLTATLIPQATSAYTADIAAGENDDYAVAVAANQAQVMKNSVISTASSTADGKRGELEFLITAYTNRLEASVAMDYVDARLLITMDWYNTIPSDDFATSMSATVDSHVDYLTALRRTLELSLGGNELDQLIAEKEDLQTELLSALDDGDLALALEIEEAIALIDAEIDALQEDQQSQVTVLDDLVDALESLLEECTDTSDTDTSNTDALLDGISAVVADLTDGVDALSSDEQSLITSAISALETAVTAAESGDTSTLSSDVSAVIDGLSDGLDSLSGDQTASDLTQSAIDDLQAALSLSETGTVDTDALIEGLSSVIDDLNDSLSDLSSSQQDTKDLLLSTIATLQDVLTTAQATDGATLATDLTSQVTDLSATLAALEGGLSDGTLGSVVVGAVADVKSALLSDDTDAVATAVDTLVEMLSLDQSLVFPYLADVYEDLSLDQVLNGNDHSDAIEAIETAILENLDAYEASLQTEKSASTLASIAEEYFTGDTDSLFDTVSTGMSDLFTTGTLFGTEPVTDDSGLGSGLSSGSGVDLTDLETLGSDSDGGVYLLALSLYYDLMGGDDVANLIGGVARRQMELGNALVYYRINDGANYYLPLSAVETLTGLRYVYNTASGTATLAKGGTYYAFTLRSTSVQIGSDTTQTMTQPASYQNGMHIIDSYAISEFAIGCIYLGSTDYGLAYTDELLIEAETLLALMLA